MIGEEAREVYSTFDWAAEGDDTKMELVLAKFAQYCEPHKNIPFEHYLFNRRTQEVGETYDQYRMVLRKLAERCDFETITAEEILRDRLVFGIKDDKVRERLLREPKLSLTRTDEICRAAEGMTAQMKVVSDNSGATVSAVKLPRKQQLNDSQDKQRMPGQQHKKAGTKQTRECWNCGRKHDLHRRELCPAYGKTCNRCNKPNHLRQSVADPRPQLHLEQYKLWMMMMFQTLDSAASIPICHT